MWNFLYKKDIKRIWVKKFTYKVNDSQQQQKDQKETKK